MKTNLQNSFERIKWADKWKGLARCGWPLLGQEKGALFPAGAPRCAIVQTAPGEYGICKTPFPTETALRLLLL